MSGLLPGKPSWQPCKPPLTSVAHLGCSLRGFDKSRNPSLPEVWVSTFKLQNTHKTLEWAQS